MLWNLRQVVSVSPRHHSKLLRQSVVVFGRATTIKSQIRFNIPLKSCHSLTLSFLVSGEFARSYRIYLLVIAAKVTETLWQL